MTSLRATLDRRHRLKNGEYPAVLILSHRGQTARLPLGVSLKSEQWDCRTRHVIGHPDKAYLNDYIGRKLNDALHTLISLRE